MTNKILAASSVALMGSGALLGATGVANADTAEQCGIPLDVTQAVIIDGICQVPFWGMSELAFTAPNGVQTLEAILIGAGAGGSSLAYGYGGGAGEVVFIDELSPTEEITVTLGAGGGEGENGGSSTLVQGAVNVTAAGGNGSTSGAGHLAATASSDGSSTHGGGSAGPATSAGPGPGYYLDEEELVGADNPLWPSTPDSYQIAVGGSVTEDDGISTPGDGGDSTLVDSAWVNSEGQDGAVVFAYRASEVSGSEPLAATGVDANTIGITAGALGAAGVALAVFAAIRRARREK